MPKRLKFVVEQWVLFMVRRQTWQAQRFKIFESARHFRIESNWDVQFEFESNLEALQVPNLCATKWQTAAVWWNTSKEYTQVLKCRHFFQLPLLLNFLLTIVYKVQKFCFFLIQTMNLVLCQPHTHTNTYAAQIQKPFSPQIPDGHWMISHPLAIFLKLSSFCCLVLLDNI